MSDRPPLRRIGLVDEVPVDCTQVAVLGPDEVRAALEALAAGEWARLKKVANLLSRPGRCEPEDLLQEALERAIDGRRRCPADVDVVKFVAEAMRSIASDAAKAAHRGPQAVSAEVLRFEKAPSPTAESVLIYRQDRADILAALDPHDDVGRTILEGDMDGIPAEELRALLELDATTYASARRRVRRRLEKAFPKGWPR